MARPKLLVLITLAEIGGAQTYVANLLPAATSEFDVTVAAWGPGPLREAARRAGADFVPLEHVRRRVSPLRDVLGLLELVALCRRVHPQIVHANSSKAGVLGRVAAWIARVPSRIFTVHGWAFAAYTGRTRSLYLWADRLVRPLTTRWICVASNERRIGIEARTCTGGRTVVIHNAVDVAAAPVASPQREPPLVVSVGRFKYPKDFPTLLDAIARIDAAPFRLELVGDGPDRAALERQVVALGIEERVSLGGERDDVPELLARASVFVLSSVSEGLPMSVIEAMAAGLPVVASDVGGLTELVVDGETGLLVPPRDAVALAGALARLLDDPALRRAMGGAGRRRAEECFDLPRFHGAHLALYRDELARR